MKRWGTLYPSLAGPEMGSMPNSFNRRFVASCHSRVIVRGGGGVTCISKCHLGVGTILTQNPEETEGDDHTGRQSSYYLPTILDFFCSWTMRTKIDIIHYSSVNPSQILLKQSHNSPYLQA